MIVVDTSALMAILQQEPGAEAIAVALARSGPTMLSAGTCTEAMIVAARCGPWSEMEELIQTSILEIIPLTQDRARRAAAAYRRFGKGFHPARLNYGDCFAYATAEEFGCPLLFVGEDFAQSDLVPAHRPD